jgi:hypothetical protein
MPTDGHRTWGTLGGVALPLGVTAGACLLATTGVLLLPDHHDRGKAGHSAATASVQYDSEQHLGEAPPDPDAPGPAGATPDRAAPSGSPSPDPSATATDRAPVGTTPPTAGAGGSLLNLPVSIPQLPVVGGQPQLPVTVPVPAPNVPQAQTTPPAAPAPARPSDISIDLVELKQGSGTLTLTNNSAGTMASWSLWIRLGGNGWFHGLTGDATTSFNQGTATAQSRKPLGPGAQLVMQWQITGDAGTIACTLNGVSCTVNTQILPPS